PSCAAIRLRGTPSIQSRSTSFTSTIVTSRYAIRPSRPPAFTAGTERTYGPGHAAHEGGKACEDLCPVGGKPCGDLSSDGGKGSDHRQAGGPAPLLRWWREPFSEKPKPPRTFKCLACSVNSTNFQEFWTKCCLSVSVSV